MGILGPTLDPINPLITIHNPEDVADKHDYSQLVSIPGKTLIVIFLIGSD